MSSLQPIQIIIVSWNVRAFLERCLRSLEKVEVPVRIFVVDNASSDGSANFVRSQFPNVTLIANDVNRGFAAAVNQAMQRTDGGHVLLLNPDCQVLAGSVERSLDYLNAHQDIGILGCQVLNEDRTNQASIRRFPTFSSQALILLKLHRVIPKNRSLQSYFATDVAPGNTQDVDQVKGAFFLIRREVITTIGLFDERFWIWFEEVDYCLRAKRAGFRVVYYPEAQVIHAGGESFRSVWTLTRQWAFNKSLLVYFRKNRPAWEYIGLFFFLPVSFILAALASPVSILRAKISTPNG
jgi:GT2 family glycosyltransferase